MKSPGEVVFLFERISENIVNANPRLKPGLLRQQSYQ